MLPSEIRAIRKRLGLTQAEIAPLIGYADAQRVSNIERGVRDPGPAVLLLLRAYSEGRLPIHWLADS